MNYTAGIVLLPVAPVAQPANGTFNGRKENIQLFFQDGKLRRIGVYPYEGNDLSTAASEWLELHDILARDFGHVETPGSNSPEASDVASRKAFVASAKEAVLSRTKTQITPQAQPADAFVFSSFWRSDHGNERTFYVVPYFDRLTGVKR